MKDDAAADDGAELIEIEESSEPIITKSHVAATAKNQKKKKKNKKAAKRKIKNEINHYNSSLPHSQGKYFL